MLLLFIRTFMTYADSLSVAQVKQSPVRRWLRKSDFDRTLDEAVAA
jgi:hypothetical protein